MERETGIEPALVAWKATVLPLNYSRPGVLRFSDLVYCYVFPARHSRESGNPASALVWWREVDYSGHPALRPSGDRSFGLLKSVPANLSNQHFVFGGSHPPPTTRIRKSNFGGGRWIRTTEGMSQQIYSLPPLAAWVSLRKF